MTVASSIWEPTEDERKAIRAALLQDRPNLAHNEQALLLAEQRVVTWVVQQEQEQSGRWATSI